MNTKKSLEPSTLGLLLARTHAADEVEPLAWKPIKHDILEISKSANAILCLAGESGAGKTTFLRQLRHSGSENIDILILNPITPSLPTGWISGGIAQWLTSDPSNSRTFQSKLSALKDIGRGILVCLDLGEITNSEQIAGEIFGLINLADSSDLRLSILISCAHSQCQTLAANHQIVNRVAYSKDLPPLSEQDLVEIISRKLKRNPPLRDAIDPDGLTALAKKAQGSPMRMIKLICGQMGMPLPTADNKLSYSVKGSKAKKNKSEQEPSTISFEDLLAPPTK